VEWRALPDPGAGRLRHDPDGRVFFHSVGEHGLGYAICLHCGRAASEIEAGDDAALPAALRDHSPLRGKRSGPCSGNDKPFARQRHLWLGTEQVTDVFELELRDPSTGARIHDVVACTSLAVALRQALAEHLGIKSDEIGYATRPSHVDGEGARAIVLFDVAQGGAGYVAAAVEALPELLRATNRILADCTCDKHCHRCLLSFQTQHDAELLDRHRALGVLHEGLLSAVDVPPSRRVTGPDDRVELRPLEAVLEDADRAGASGVQVFLSDAARWDLAEWRALAVLRRSRCPVELVVPEGVLAALPPDARDLLGRQGQPLAVRLCDEPPAVKGSPLVAAVLGGGRPARYFVPDTRWTAPGRDWASPDAGPVIRVDGAGKPWPTRAVPLDRLRQEPGQAREVTLDGPELDGPLASFGARFWGRLGAGAPLLEEKLRSGLALAAVTYRDRYVRCPQVVASLFAVLQALVTGRGAPEVRLETGPVDGRNIGSAMHHDWASEKEQLAVLQGVLGHIGAEVRVARNSFDLPHARNLLLRFVDGVEVNIRLDHGFGAFRTARPLRFPFSDPASQAAAILGATHSLRVHDGPTLAVVRVGT
jgi:hypothetical protein